MSIKNFGLSGLIIVIIISFLLQGCIEPTKPNVIQGVITEVEYIAEGSSFNASDIKKTIIKFKDGRVKSFEGISDMVFQKGKFNVITYNNSNKITSVMISK